jgi:serine phosphatase RsbU (regulator of sigma subunit)
VNAPRSVGDLFGTYTRDLKAEDLQRLFTRDTREAYRFFARHVDFSQIEGLPWHRRVAAHVRLFFFAFTMKLSPARRAVYAGALICALLGLVELFFGPRQGGARAAVPVPTVLFPDGTGWVVLAFLLVNLLVLLEVADRLSLKNDLEVARDIQQAMLPSGLYAAPGVETLGLSRPANTVGGDFYDILPLQDGRLVIAVGDVAGKGSPASLLMALLLSMLRTLVGLLEEARLNPSELVSRLNVQVCRHSPGSRFITLFCGVYDPRSGVVEYVTAGHPPPLVLRGDGSFDQLAEGGMAVGMFERSTYATGRALLNAGDVLAIYSDGITEAESPAGKPFDVQGLEAVLRAERDKPVAAIGSAVVRAVEVHTADVRFADDLTILLLRRVPAAAAAGV